MRAYFTHGLQFASVPTTSALQHSICASEVTKSSHPPTRSSDDGPIERRLLKSSFFPVTFFPAWILTIAYRCSQRQALLAWLAPEIRPVRYRIMRSRTSAQ